MLIFELILLAITYTTLTIALFLEILCFKRKIENIENIIFTISLLLMIVSFSISPLFSEAKAETTLATLLSMTLISSTTFLSVLGERQHQLKSWIINIHIVLTVGLSFAIISCFFMDQLHIIELPVVSFLILSLISAMGITKITKPKKQFAHQERINKIFSNVLIILIPSYLVLHYGFVELYDYFPIFFLIPIVFTLMGVYKIYDDLQRLSILNHKGDTKIQQFKNYGLTKREEEVARLLLKGLTYKNISEQLFISLPTVKSHASNLYKKCKVKSRHELSVLISN